ncbi:MAG: hypothetical protein ABSF41_14175 [Pseudolabrys sp.]
MDNNADPKPGEGDAVSDGSVGGAKRLTTLSQRVEAIREIGFNTLVVGLLLLFVGVVAKATLKRGIVIEPISVPKELSDRGYTGEAVAQQLIDEINATYSEAETTFKAETGREFGTISKLESEQSTPKVKLPGAGISMAAIIYYTRDFFGFYSVKLSGEIAQENPPQKKSGQEKSAQTSPPEPPKIILRARMAAPSFYHQSPDSSENLAQLLKGAAFPILEKINPYIAGVIYLHRQDLNNATRMAQHCISSDNANDRQWGFALQGAIALTQKRFAEGREQFLHALDDFPNFALAHYNLAVVANNEGKYTSALEASLNAIMLDGNSRRQSIGYHNAAVALMQMSQIKISYKGTPDISLNLNQLFGAQDSYPFQGSDFFGSQAQAGGLPGTLILGLKDGEIPSEEAAIAMLRRAIDADPTSSNSYYVLGTVEYDDNAGGKKDAEQKFEKAISLFSANTLAARKAWAHHYLGRIRADNGDFNSAFKEFSLAIGFDLNFAWPHLRWAQALIKQADKAKSSEEAMRLRSDAEAKLERARDLAAGDSSISQEVRAAFEKLGKPDRATIPDDQIAALEMTNEKDVHDKNKKLPSTAETHADRTGGSDFFVR